MNEANPPSSDSLAPQSTQTPAPGQSGWVKQVEAEPASAYPPPPGSASNAPAPGLSSPPANPAPASLDYPSAPVEAHTAQPQVVHNTVVQNHYHTGSGAQLVRTSSRDRTIAVLFAFFLGSLGVHRYYLGRPGSATVMLVMSLTGILLPVVWIWSLVDMISLMTTSRERFELRYNCSIAPGALPPPS